MRIFIIIFFLLFSFNVFSYDNDSAHPKLTEAAINIYNNQAGTKLDDEKRNWIVEGSIAEDADPRYLNHFYNPVNNTGLNDLGFKGVSAKDWANLQNSATGDYSVKKILDNYKENNKSRAYQGIGHIIHLIEDMAVPAHVRNDAHPDGDPYEAWVKEYGVINSSKANLIYINNINQAFDDLSSFTNKNFLSRDSLILKNINIYSTIEVKYNNKITKYLTRELNGQIYKYIIIDNITSLPVKYNDNFLLNLDYWNMLHPKAIGYSAGVIDYFIREFNKIDLENKNKISFLGNILNSIDNFYDDIKYYWGDTVIASRTRIESALGLISDTTENSWQNINYFAEANKEVIENTAIKTANTAKVLGEKTVSEIKNLNIKKNNIQNTIIKNIIIDPVQAITNKDNEVKVINEEDNILNKNEKNNLNNNIDVIVLNKNNFLFTAGDNTPPDTSIITDAKNISSSTEYIFKLISSEANSKFLCNLDNTSWNECDDNIKLINLEDGVHSLKAAAFDSAGNIDKIPAVFTWQIDITSPEIIFIKSPNKFSGSTAAFFEITFNEETVSLCRLDNNEFNICIATSSFENLSEGEHNFNIIAEDKLGNIASSTYAWAINQSLPIINIINKPDKFSSSTVANFQFIFDDEIIYNYNLDYNSEANSSATTTYYNLNEGNHILNITALDKFGLSSTLSYDWIIDINAPTVIMENLNPINNNIGFLISWNGQDSSSSTSEVSGVDYYNIEYKINDNGWQTWINNSSSTSAIFNNSVNNNDYIYFRSRAVDRAGNIGEWSNVIITKIETVPQGHIVISDFQIDGNTSIDEYVRLYNPTARTINLKNYRLARKSSSGVEYILLSKLPNYNLKPNTYYLIAHPTGYSGFYYKNTSYSSSSYNIAEDNTVILYSIYSDSEKVIADKVGFGSSSDYEGSPYPVNPGCHQSLMRKAVSTSTAEDLIGSGDHIDLGNGYDTDNNSEDFVIVDNPLPL